MKSFLAILFCTLMGSTFAGNRVGYFKNPDYPGKCMINKDLILSERQRVNDPNEKCGEMYCCNGEEGKVVFVSCVLTSSKGNCEIKAGNSSLNYPGCCPVFYNCPNF